MVTTPDQFLKLVEQEAAHYCTIRSKYESALSPYLISSRFMKNVHEVTPAIGMTEVKAWFHLPSSSVHPYDESDKIVYGVEYLIADRPTVEDLPRALKTSADNPVGVIAYQNSIRSNYALVLFNLRDDIVSTVDVGDIQEQILTRVKGMELEAAIREFFFELFRIRGTLIRDDAVMDKT